MRKYILALGAVFGLMIPTAAYANSGSVTDTSFLGNDAQCGAVLNPFACQAQETGAWGEGASGWSGHYSVNGSPFVEPASFGFTFNGAEFNVYESLGSTFTDSLEWLLPAGVNVDNYALGVSAYNAGWVPGRGIVVPN